MIDNNIAADFFSRYILEAKRWIICERKIFFSTIKINNKILSLLPSG
ncbi:hypothetical protein GLYMA_06G058700v4 [Glycine max]|uniref:Uncharacterized protein n=1 Tax=Glycine max TaxID=3847 RepID=A0A0R0JCJ7_SOYBN|nr:hypothetical protein GYH30_014209 [Glycine max]KRH52286.1 hypothetical protein GLYMA_06G058700v4 [Glycine max]